MPDVDLGARRYRIGFWTSREEGSGEFLLINEYGAHLSLNTTAMTILRQLTEGMAVHEVAIALQDRYGISRDRSMQVVLGAVETLSMTGMLHDFSKPAG
jgi:hypothetical protein